MSLSTRENTLQARESQLLQREAALAEREARLLERENRILAKEKWAAELHEREQLIHERERIIHEREQRLERLLRENEDKMDFEIEKGGLGISLIEMGLMKVYVTSPPRRPLQESKSFVFNDCADDSANRPDLARYQTAPGCASYPPPQYTVDKASENTLTIASIPEIPTSPTRLQMAQNFLSPRRRRTTLGSPTRQANPALSPTKSHTNLRAEIKQEPMPPPRKHISVTLNRPETRGGLVKIAARNTFRGRETEVVDWDKECEVNEMDMPSPFIRRRRTARQSAGTSRA